MAGRDKHPSNLYAAWRPVPSLPMTCFGLIHPLASSTDSGLPGNPTDKHELSRKQGEAEVRGSRGPTKQMCLRNAGPDSAQGHQMRPQDSKPQRVPIFKQGCSPCKVQDIVRAWQALSEVKVVQVGQRKREKAGQILKRSRRRRKASKTKQDHKGESKETRQRQHEANGCREAQRGM